MKIIFLIGSSSSDARCGWKPHLPGLGKVRLETAPTGSGESVVGNRTYRVWGKYRIIELFFETSYSLRYICQHS